jgi:hypothetical protein
LFVFPGSQDLIRGAPVDAPTRAPRVHATRAPQRRGTLVVRHVARSESKCRCAPAVLVLRVARRRRMMIVESLFLAVAFVGVANSARATRCIPLLQSSPLVFAQCFCRQICFPAPCWRGWVASSALGSQTSQLRAFKQAWLKRWGARCDGKTCRVSMRLARETTYFLVRKVCGLWRVCVCVRVACGLWLRVGSVATEGWIDVGDGGNCAVRFVRPRSFKTIQQRRCNAGAAPIFRHNHVCAPCVSGVVVTLGCNGRGSCAPIVKFGGLSPLEKSAQASRQDVCVAMALRNC